jgi:hypothetical protein
VPAARFAGDAGVAAQAAQLAGTESGTTERLASPSPRVIVALWWSTKLPDRP